MQTYHIRKETAADYRTVENLTREAFWNVYRPGCTEHYVLHCFRQRPDFVPELDLVLEADGEIIGHVMYARAAIRTDDGRILPIMTFGPLSIAPRCKGQGFGTILLRESMQRAKALGAGALAITGNIGFYGKAGFAAGKTKGIRYWDDPDAEYFLVAELEPGFLDGVTGTYKDPDGYFVDEQAAAAFDAAFPPKEKRRLPGQLI